HRYLGPAIVSKILSPMVVELTDKNGQKLGKYYAADLKIPRRSLHEFKMSATTKDKDELLENLQALELDDETENADIEKTTISAASSELDLKEAAASEKRMQKEESSSKETIQSTKARWNKRGELDFFSSDEDDKAGISLKDDVEQNMPTKDDENQSPIEKWDNQNPAAKSLIWDEAKIRSIEMRSYRPPLKSSVRARSNIEVEENPPSSEAIHLIREIRSRSPPRIKLGSKTVRITPAQLHAENLKRNRIPKEPKELQRLKDSNRPRLTTDDPDACLAPSIMVRPATCEIPTFRELLRELGLEKNVQEQPGRPLYFVESRMLSEEALKDLICRRAEMLVARKDSKTVTRGTQTYVSQAGKPRVQGCVNCRSYTHHARECSLPYRPGFCQICFADGYDTKDCIYPHGVEHEAALSLCVGCGGDLSLYCPECPDYNIRYKDIVDWLRLNYATWPTWAIPADHRYLVNEGTEILKRRVKAKFDDPNDVPNRVRKFLIRENALSIAPVVVNRNVSTMGQLSEEKRQLALRALTHPLVDKTLDEIMRERPELGDGAEIKVLVPTKYQHRATKE
ncbi:hypothetical protein PV325_012036, partial [Microctonus aethiopoides]